MRNRFRFPRRRDRLRRVIGATVVDNIFRSMAGAGALLPAAKPARNGIEVIKDIPYRPTSREDHRLDIWRPIDRDGPTPVVMYIHGGGFRILSKDTHWIFATSFARRGFTVVNINYRLAPGHPFPAALEDVAAAWRWTHDNVDVYGGDPDNVSVAGESAGANLSLALSVAACYEREEPWARAIYETGAVPTACLPAFGLLEVRNPERFFELGLPRVAVDRISEVTAAYVDLADVDHDDWMMLADPLTFLEDGNLPHRELPPFFIATGHLDFLIGDSRRLKVALDELGVTAELREYPRLAHAMHGFLPFPSARKCWRDKFTFLEQVLGMPLPDIAPDDAPYKHKEDGREQAA
jgi:acetyl esterase